MRVDAARPIPPPRPWYRERWPWALFAGPAIVVVAALVTLWLAVTSDDGVVADDYYRRGLLINKELERARKAEATGIGAVLRLTDDGTLRVRLDAREGDPPAPLSVRVRFAHATRAGLDRSAVVARGSDGEYVGRIEPLPAGRWLVTVETDEWRLPAAEVSFAAGDVRLGAATAAR